MKLTTQIRLMNVAGLAVAVLGALLGVAALIVSEGDTARGLGTLSVVLIGLGAGMHWMMGGQELPPPEVAAVLDAVDSIGEKNKKPKP